MRARRRGAPLAIAVSAASASRSAGLGRIDSTKRRTAASGCAPSNAPASVRSRIAFTAGMLRTWNACASAGFASMSTRASTNAPACSSASRSRIGPSTRHGPHHGAQKSTTTGT
jgi:hypothetical protein